MRALWFAKRIVPVYALIWIVFVLIGPGNLDLLGRPKGTDFLTLYAAGKLALRGSAEAAYLPELQDERVKISAIPKERIGVNLFPYPPPYLLIAALLALLPYTLSYLAWSLSTAGLFTCAVYFWTRSRDSIYFALAAPAVFLCLAQGQSSLLIAAVFALGMLLLGDRPFAAGLLLGVMAIKPQLAFATFAVLLWSRNIRALCGIAVTIIVSSAAAACVFGVTFWPLFLHNITQSASGVSQALYPLYKYPTVMGMLRLMGASSAPAWGLQLFAAALALAGLFWIWARCGSVSLRAAVLAVGTFLITPYAHEYDLTLVVLPAVLSLTGGTNAEELPGSALFAAAYLMPAAAPAIAYSTNVQLMPVILGSLFFALIRGEKRL